MSPVPVEPGRSLPGRSLPGRPPTGGRPTAGAQPDAPQVVDDPRQRRITIAGLDNLRDIGGYVGADGRAVRWGQVYRSDGLSHLRPGGLAALQTLRIAAVFDLRNDGERAQRPNPEPFAGRGLSIEHGVDFFDGAALISRQTYDDGAQLLTDLYLGMVERAGRATAEVLTGMTLAVAEGGSVVFHCVAGKDRTGFVAAILLRTLGVDRDTVLDDYELTPPGHLLPRDVAFVTELRNLGMGSDAIEAFLGTPRTSLAAALDRIDEAHGGTEAYLSDVGGMPMHGIESLRHLLLEPT